MQSDRERLDIAHALIRSGTRLTKVGLAMLQGRHLYDADIRKDLRLLHQDITDVLIRYADQTKP